MNTFDPKTNALLNAIHNAGEAYTAAGGKGLDVVRVLLGVASGAMVNGACCPQHLEERLVKLAREFIQSGMMAAPPNSHPVDPTLQAGAKSVVDGKSLNRTVQQIRDEIGDGLVAYVGKGFGPQGYRPFFMACVDRSTFEKLLVEQGSITLEVNVGEAPLVVQLCATETREAALKRIESIAMTPDELEAANQSIGATRN